MEGWDQLDSLDNQVQWAWSDNLALLANRDPRDQRARKDQVWSLVPMTYWHQADRKCVALQDPRVLQGLQEMLVWRVREDHLVNADLRAVPALLEPQVYLDQLDRPARLEKEDSQDPLVCQDCRGEVYQTKK